MSDTSNISTPVPSVSKKRDLSSPEELSVSKKNRSNGDFVDTLCTDSDASATMAATNLALDDTAVQSIADALRDTVISRISDTMTVMVEAIVKGVIAGLSTRIGKLESENELLKARVYALEGMADTAEQYSRRNCLRVAGVPESPGENTDDIIIGLCKDMGTSVSLPEIDRTHRVGKPDPSGKKPRAIIVKFATYRARQTVYKKRTTLRQCGHGGVFLNEDLTRARADLLYQARQLVRSNRIESAWSSDGTILVKAAGSIRRIQTPADLSVFKVHGAPGGGK